MKCGWMSAALTVLYCMAVAHYSLFLSIVCLPLCYTSSAWFALVCWAAWSDLFCAICQRRWHYEIYSVRHFPFFCFISINFQTNMRQWAAMRNEFKPPFEFAPSKEKKKIISMTFLLSMRIFFLLLAISLYCAWMMNERTSIRHLMFSNPFVPSMLVVDDKTLKIWDAVTGHVKATLKGHSNTVTSVAISHDGTTIVSGSCE